ncbi:MAG: T9SS type A sorting domain-containing protein [Ignavibacteriaceae bacterium]|nr:T9SS type A sorting domain-containing protein [Ignavibacteriaceae bacterium]
MKTILTFNPVIAFIYFLLAYFLIPLPRLLAQNDQQEKHVLPWEVERLDEIPDDQYIPVQKEKQQRSPAYRFSTDDFFTVQVNVDQFGQNIVGDAANEPSIAVDPANPNNMAIGWRQFDTISSNFRQAGYAYSTDGGLNWTTGIIEQGIFRSDPVLGADNYSKLFYYSLSTSGSYTCELFNSVDGGATWLGSVPAYGGDKGWMTIDRTGSMGEGNIYCFSRDDIATTIVMTRSIDGGQSFQPLVNVPGNPGRGTLAVGADGVLYAVGLSFNNGQFAFARSTNAPDSQATPVFDFSTQINLGGQFSSYAGPNPDGLLGQTIVACDYSGQSGDSTVYVLSSVDPPGEDPLDVNFIRSTDRGLSWSSPVRINDDSGTSAWQWFGTMSVAPNGRIDVVWLDTRDDPGTYMSSLYYSFSEDNGQTWSQNERLSTAFNPHVGWPQQNKMGDYFDMISDEEGVSLAWAGTFNGEEDIYYSRISQMPVSINNGQDNNRIPKIFSLYQNYPNPFNPSTKIKFTIPSVIARETKQSQLVTLKIYDVLGNEISTLVNEEKAAGNYEVDFIADGLPSGIYFYKLQAGSFVETKKMILLK